MRSGSRAQNANPRMRPSGCIPAGPAADALMTSVAAPPSVICEELPAVTVPNLPVEIGPSFASASRVWFSRTPLSCVAMP